MAITYALNTLIGLLPADSYPRICLSSKEPSETSAQVPCLALKGLALCTGLIFASYAFRLTFKINAYLTDRACLLAYARVNREPAMPRLTVWSFFWIPSEKAHKIAQQRILSFITDGLTGDEKVQCLDAVQKAFVGKEWTLVRTVSDQITRNMSLQARVTLINDSVKEKHS